MDRAVDGSGLIGRSRLGELGAKALTKRLTALVAGPGFGKTTLLTQLFDPGRAIWHTATATDRSFPALARSIVDKTRLQIPGLSNEVALAAAGSQGSGSEGRSGRAEAIASGLARELEDQLRRDVVLVIDDLHEIQNGTDSALFLAGLIRNAPTRLHVVTASRSDLPFPVSRMLLNGDAVVQDEKTLAFTIEEIEELVRLRGLSLEESAIDHIFALTGGWPVAVIYSLEALHEDGSGIVVPRAEEGRLFEYLVEEVLGREDPGLVEALSLLSFLPWFTIDLLDRLGGRVEAIELFDPTGVSRFALTPVPDVANASTVSPLIASYLVEQSRSASRESLDVVLADSADWYLRNEHLSEALTCLTNLSTTEQLGLFLEENGEELIARGLTRQLDEAAVLVEDASPQVALMRAEVKQLLGDWEGAMDLYRMLVPETGPIPASLAWRLGFLYHMRGDITAALTIYERGEVRGDDPSAGASLLAWHASAHWLRGDREAAEDLADRALVLARSVNASRPLATVYTVLAMIAALDGDRAQNDSHYLRALEHAERSRDVTQTIRIRSNRGSHFLEEGKYQLALDELEIALRLADMTGFELWKGMALSNRGQVVKMIGRLDEAIADLSESRRIFRSIASNFESYPLAQLGDVYTLRGDTALARACYEDSISLAEDQGDLQALVPALSGLARLIAFEDNKRASALAARACEVDAVIWRSVALLAAGFVALAGDDLEAASRLASEAAGTARSRRDMHGLAEALELTARCQTKEEAIETLGQARVIWHEIGFELGCARVDVELARLIGPPDGIATARVAGETLARLGAKRLASEASSVAEDIAEQRAAAVRVKTLGGFSVSVGGVPVPNSSWQSRVAREVLAMLVAARGIPIHRETLIDRLWPDEELDKASNRLSVALSTIRSVLDPEKAHHTDWYLERDGETLALSTDRVTVDATDFLEAAKKGQSAIRSGDQERGRALLDYAETIYVGEFLEDYPYADWAVAPREEIRSWYLRVASQLAEVELSEGDFDGASRRFLRMLERDPFDEPTHLSLIRAMVGAGRHGTARRLYGNYVSRMAELGIEPDSFPG